MSCERLSDRMPGVVAGRDHLSREDEEHLAVCSDCRSEWLLLARGATLGISLPLDAERIAGRVQDRLLAARRETRLARRSWIVAVTAAAAALLLIIYRPDGTESIGTIPPLDATGLELPIIELDSLSSEQLQAVLESLEPPLGSTSTLDAPTLQDLDDHQLERLLRSLEG